MGIESSSLSAVRYDVIGRIGKNEVRHPLDRNVPKPAEIARRLQFGKLVSAEVIGLLRAKDDVSFGRDLGLPIDHFATAIVAAESLQASIDSVTKGQDGTFDYVTLKKDVVSFLVDYVVDKVGVRRKLRAAAKGAGAGAESKSVVSASLNEDGRDVVAGVLEMSAIFELDKATLKDAAELAKLSGTFGFHQKRHLLRLAYFSSDYQLQDAPKTHTSRSSASTASVATSVSARSRAEKKSAKSEKSAKHAATKSVDGWSYS